MTEELTWLDAWSIRELIVRGEISATTVVDHFLGRIEEFNPTLRAFAHLDPTSARKQARLADEAQRQGDTLGPLHGIPIAVKENLSVAGVAFSFPRRGMSGVSAYDAIAVERLRAAGAVIVGTNTMMGTSAARPSEAQPEAPMVGMFNWAAEARNPWDTARVPGWSSAGGAAATAAGLLPVTIGSDGGGSTRLPAAFSGVVGVHPTQGLIPHVDYTRAALRLTATNGPLTRSVRDAALVTQVLAGPDGRDYICIQQQPADYLAALEDGIDGMRLAWTDDYGFAAEHATEESPRVIALAREVAFGLHRAGAVVEETSMVWESARRGGGPGVGEPAVYEIDVSANTHPLPATDPELYRAALEWRARNWEGFQSLFADYDLLLSVTSQHIAPTWEEWQDSWTTAKHAAVPGGYAEIYTAHTVLFNLLGFPAVTVPCGFVDGMPVGLQIVGPPSSEDRIFRLASAVQQAYPRSERPSLS
ncbi:amidase [Cryptosporangium aurantiacum]|uniref:Aspartyl-tRNA(Asn)/glutamyl-tRNA(Gln) amidotransferase subunit A n=1 Tax=Cryptosporangium aurantiacum TaxID=134849 RepID=A0A1M7PQB9_9ACTN|nr:amidase [Cryptosporangium aurantiacum]SHN19599.1 aspartyl-tRNA(Asn)/glutamyl-tRNA(Gln) amidotransferase subunit A [Cryptosporangium aurantiacum]